ncbi:MAG: tRNA preQ1(34) S-adenosylmethionine ribosyltransferase-isomerase QueA [Candidatus Magasanikbacteria bacterium]|nr:tRNA preQ1(34) S-adenosylmethionine ribosyltransferase-isomerase QueA [Candidatus Magasanikbacteria bacterium]
MLTKDFNYNLPPSLIAQTPASPRDSSRLMVVDRNQQTFQDKHFFEITEYLQAGDLVVWNNSKVFKARLHGQVILNNPADGIDEKFNPTGKILNTPEVEIFLVRPMENKGVWKALAKPGRKLRLGMKVQFASDFVGEVLLKDADGTILMQFGEDDLAVRAKANKYGEVPTPPYVKSSKFKVQSLKLSERYQTVYAKYEGSVAAPTAGFHFTPELIGKLQKKGVQFAEVTLHVGLGTFLPVKTDTIEDHHMHSEWVELTAKNADLINQAQAEGRRVVAVGTTTVRTLEGVAKLSGGNLKPYSGDIDIFIVPGFAFQVVDVLITNFHLPESTLLMLVVAFIGDRKFTLACYEHAIRERYRFYSFGDAMFIK